MYPAYAWTPDGRAIVIYSAGGFFRVDVASGRATRIPFVAPVEQIVTHAVRFPQTLDQDLVRVKQIAWPSRSPDRKSIAFAALGRIWRYDVAEQAAQSADAARHARLGAVVVARRAFDRVRVVARQRRRAPVDDARLRRIAGAAHRRWRRST